MTVVERAPSLLSRSFLSQTCCVALGFIWQISIYSNVFFCFFLGYFAQSIGCQSKMARFIRWCGFCHGGLDCRSNVHGKLSKV